VWGCQEGEVENETRKKKKTGKEKIVKKKRLKG